MFNRPMKLRKEEIVTPEVKLTVIGTGASGKTYLLNAIHNLIMKDMGIRHGLKISALNAEEMTKLSIDIENNIESMKTSPLLSTFIRYDFTFQLYHQTKPIIKIIYRDDVGQILTNNSDDVNKMRSNFINDIKKAEVVWVLLPAQADKDGQYLGCVSDKDIALAEAYLQDALQNRPTNHPLVLAILLTKADILKSDLDDDNSKNEFEKISTILSDRFDWLVSCDFISSAAFFPVSAMGLNNTRLSGEMDRGAPTYFLNGNDLEPYNITKLLLWSLAAAGYHNKNLKIDESLKRSLTNSLNDIEGIIYPIKSNEDYR